jgi:hypothetical protein
MRKTNKPVLEVARIVSRFRKIMIEAQKAEIRVLLCGTIPDPRRLVDAKLRLLDEALKDLDMSPGNNFVGFRGLMFNANGKIRKELFKRSNIHLSEEGAEVVGPRIRLMFDVMCPPLESDVVQPAQTTVPVVLAQPVVQAPPVVQQVAPVVQDSEMDCGPPKEGKEQTLRRLFLQRFGYPLPEIQKKSDVDDIDKNLIDLTCDDDEEMEAFVAAPSLDLVPVQVVIKTEVAEAADEDPNPNTPTAANVAAAQKERRELAKSSKAIKIFAKTLIKPTPNPAPKKIRKVIRVAAGVDNVIP